MSTLLWRGQAPSCTSPIHVRRRAVRKGPWGHSTGLASVIVIPTMYHGAGCCTHRPETSAARAAAALQPAPAATCDVRLRRPRPHVAHPPCTWPRAHACRCARRTPRMQRPLSFHDFRGVRRTALQLALEGVGAIPLPVAHAMPSHARPQRSLLARWKRRMRARSTRAPRLGRSPR